MSEKGSILLSYKDPLYLVPNLSFHYRWNDRCETGNIPLYELVNRFKPGIFRCNRPMTIIVSKSMKRYLSNPEIPIYYNDIIISHFWSALSWRSLTRLSSTTLRPIPALAGRISVASRGGRPLVYWFNGDKWRFLSEGHCEERSDEAISDDKADCHALRARNDTVFTAFALIRDISPFLTLLQGSSPATPQPAPPAS